MANGQTTKERQAEIRDIGRPAMRRYVIGALVGYVILWSGVLWGLNEVRETGDSVRSEQVKTCLIQNTGLEAKKYLDGSLEGIHALLQPLPGEAKPAQPVPPSVLNVVKKLNHNLAEYNRIEKKLPKGRKC